jgi:hypothetical protein
VNLFLFTEDIVDADTGLIFWFGNLDVVIEIEFEEGKTEYFKNGFPYIS